MDDIISSSFVSYVFDLQYVENEQTRSSNIYGILGYDRQGQGSSFKSGPIIGIIFSCHTNNSYLSV